MCGIAGFIGFDSLRIEDVYSTAQSMGAEIHHRGPDDSGVWVDKQAQVAMIHRRLSILDLSSAGHQPMMSSSGRYVIIFNGEIYNHKEVRSALDYNLVSAERDWMGHSDTETLLAAIEVWGFEATLKKVRGMFAIALWDRKHRDLYLARDRIGEKPLYYGWQQGVFLFGSELKSLRIHPAFNNEIDRNSLCLQLRHSYIPAPYSIYVGINKLLPGHYLKISSTSRSTISGSVSKPYWSLQQILESNNTDVFSYPKGDAISSLDSLLRDIVAEQMLADVPLGAFLSGGIDSTLIVSLMQSLSTNPVNTFTIGFNESGYDEAKYAKSIANYLGTNHTEMYVTSEQALDVIPYLPILFDEPFSDPSQIPTYLVSKMTKQHVTVALSGDAGDELFGGYNRYFQTEKWWGTIDKVPLFLRLLASKAISSTPPYIFTRIAHVAAAVSSNRLQWPNLANNIYKISSILAVDSRSKLYNNFVSNWHDPGAVVVNGSEPITQIDTSKFNFNNIVDQMMALDTITYLPDDILCKVDRASMGASLETRVPMLDHRAIEFAWQLPRSMKIRDGQGKWILREILDKYVPRELIHRPKMGFGVPIDAWLRGSMRDWAESLIDESRLKSEGYFHPAPIRQKWNEHVSQRRNWQYHLWDVLMFQVWLESQ